MVGKENKPSLWRTSFIGLFLLVILSLPVSLASTQDIITDTTKETVITQKDTPEKTLWKTNPYESVTAKELYTTDEVDGRGIRSGTVFRLGNMITLQDSSDFLDSTRYIDVDEETVTEKSFGKSSNTYVTKRDRPFFMTGSPADSLQTIDPRTNTNNEIFSSFTQSSNPMTWIGKPFHMNSLKTWNHLRSSSDTSLSLQGYTNEWSTSNTNIIYEENKTSLYLPATDGTDPYIVRWDIENESIMETKQIVNDRFLWNERTGKINVLDTSSDQVIEMTKTLQTVNVYDVGTNVTDIQATPTKQYYIENTNLYEATDTWGQKSLLNDTKDHDRFVRNRIMSNWYLGNEDQQTQTYSNPDVTNTYTERYNLPTSETEWLPTVIFQDSNWETLDMISVTQNGVDYTVNKDKKAITIDADDEKNVSLSFVEQNDEYQTKSYLHVYRNGKAEEWEKNTSFPIGTEEVEPKVKYKEFPSERGYIATYNGSSFVFEANGTEDNRIVEGTIHINASEMVQSSDGSVLGWTRDTTGEFEFGTAFDVTKEKDKTIMGMSIFKNQPNVLNQWKQSERRYTDTVVLDEVVSDIENVTIDFTLSNYQMLSKPKAYVHSELDIQDTIPSEDITLRGTLKQTGPIKVTPEEFVFDKINNKGQLNFTNYNHTIEDVTMYSHNYPESLLQWEDKNYDDRSLYNFLFAPRERSDNVVNFTFDSERKWTMYESEYEHAWNGKETWTIETTGGNLQEVDGNQTDDTTDTTQQETNLFGVPIPETSTTNGFVIGLILIALATALPYFSFQKYQAEMGVFFGTLMFITTTFLGFIPLWAFIIVIGMVGIAYASRMRNVISGGV